MKHLVGGFVARVAHGGGAVSLVARARDGFSPELGGIGRIGEECRSLDTRGERGIGDHPQRSLSYTVVLGGVRKR